MRSSVLIALAIAALIAGCTPDTPAPPPVDTAVAPAPAAATSTYVGVARTWPQFRGVTGDGIADETARPPLDVDPATDTLWKTPVAASGYSSPIVWGDRIFLTGEGHRIMAFDASTGEPVWNTTLQPPPEPPVGEDEWPFEPGEYGTAIATACTDGVGVYAMFCTGVIGGVSMDGEPIWVKRLVVRPPNMYGLSASPIAFEGVVIQLVDLDADDEGDEPVFRSFIVGLSAANGEELWRTPRPVYGSWGSPLLIDDGAGTQLVTCADPWTISYGPTTGKEYWRAGGVAGELAATPIATDRRIYAFGDPTGAIQAISRGVRGDVTDSAIEWTYDEDVPEVPSGIVAAGKVIYIGSGDQLRSLDAATGEPGWTLPLPDSVYASPVLAAGKLIIIDTEGVLHVVDPELGKIVHAAEIGEPVSSSPAIVGGRIYIRTRTHLMCLGRDGD